jgi:hypothetical protein
MRPIWFRFFLRQVQIVDPAFNNVWSNVDLKIVTTRIASQAFSVGFSLVAVIVAVKFSVVKCIPPDTNNPAV